MTSSARKIDRLRRENARLRDLLSVHGIPDNGSETVGRPARPESGAAELPVSEKLFLFRRLFRGREDIHAVRWEAKDGRSGYAPACGNEWRPGICEKPRIKCAQCAHRSFLPLTDQVLFDHLSGAKTIGVYPLLPGDRCWFLAVDFDGAGWRQDISAFRATCVDVHPNGATHVRHIGAS